MFKKIINLINTYLDKKYVIPSVPTPEICSYKSWQSFLVEKMNIQNYKILEVGSREVTQNSTLRKDFNNAHYTGFDYKSGPNVDIVGDAHSLSNYFNNDEEFDLIFSSATFEHFDRPWIVAEEIAKLLRVGGFVFVETHFSYRTHERPWNFFQFSDMGLKSLFSEKLGFESIDAGMYNPIVGRFSSLARKNLRRKKIAGLYCHSCFWGKKVRSVSDFNWRNSSTSEVVSYQEYPQ